MIKHIVFDIDGVLVNSLEANHVSLLETMKEFGFNADHTPFIKSPVPTTKKLAYLEESQGITLTDQQRKDFVVLKYMNLVKQFDLLEFNKHTTKVFKWCKKNGVATSFVSNARSCYIRHILGKFKWLDNTVCIVGNDAGLPHKPNPDMWYYAAKEMNADPSNILVVEDCEVNIEAAKKAGFQTLYIQTFDDLLRIIK